MTVYGGTGTDAPRETIRFDNTGTGFEPEVRAVAAALAAGCTECLPLPAAETAARAARGGRCGAVGRAVSRRSVSSRLFPAFLFKIIVKPGARSLGRTASGVLQ
ncbi:MAG: hypothetical protein ACLRZH_14395 [Ruthenibacterium lactatiformans]